MSVQVFDTTLRDGAQREGLTFSVADKLAIARLLDEFGVGFIEGGWPGAMPKDTEFFSRARTELDLKNAVLVAFGATRRADLDVKADPQVQALLAAETPVVCLVAKSDIRHVERALRTTGDQNLVDGTRNRRIPSVRGPPGSRRLRALLRRLRATTRRTPLPSSPPRPRPVPRRSCCATRTAACCRPGSPRRSAPCATCCPDRDTALGIHCQNDTACAVANTIAAVEAGVVQVQCTANGYGERPGNADLFAVVANLQLKLGMPVLPDGCLEQMVRVSHAIAEIANLAPDTHQAYVGAAAFAHKAGLHASAIKVDPLLYNHVDPDVVGNDMKILVTEMAGRASIELKSRSLGIDLSSEPEALAVRDRLGQAAGGAGVVVRGRRRVVRAAGARGAAGRRGAAVHAGVLPRHGRAPVDGAVLSEATVKLLVRGERVIAIGEGNGPVNALDNALRSALRQAYPALETFELADYKVRILAGSHGTSAVTRVLVETVDDRGRDWTTVGVHDNVVEASWHALVDALTFGLTE